MAEVMGIISSVLALSEAVIGSVKLAGELYRAPEEIRALDEQVRSFRSLVNQIHAVAPTRSTSLQGILSQPLCTAQHAIQELDFLLKAKLLKQGQGSNRARRRAWLRHKSSISLLRSKLRDAREMLSIGLNTYLIIRTEGLGSSLASIDHQATSNHAKSMTTIESLVKANTAKTLPPSETLMRNSLQALLQSSDSRSASTQRISTWMQPFMPFTSAFDNCCDKEGTAQSFSSEPEAQEAQDSSDGEDILCTAPITMFEASSSFLPEVYTTNEAKPSLFSHSSCLDQVSEYTRINQYAMFYESSPRQWIRISVSVTISMESPYWQVMSISKGRDVLFAFCYGLPPSLGSEFNKFLKQTPKLKSDSHFSIFLGSTTPRIQVEKRPTPVTGYLRQATKTLRHFNCPWYSERNLIHYPKGSVKFNREFIAFVDSRWLLEYRFGSERSEIDAALYMLHVLHCLSTVPGVNPFRGMIIDEHNGIAKGFLTDLPTKGVLFRSLTRPIAWDRREKWCRQLIRGVAEVHSRGFVIGSLGNAVKSRIYVDSEDNVVLHRFQTFSNFDQLSAGGLPPERRHLEVTEGSFTATPQTDLYQLGLILWLIAENRYTHLRSEFCRMADCPAYKTSACSEEHGDPIQLPKLGSSTPEYLREIIISCRAENPDERPPAWQLVRMFSEVETMSPDTDSRIMALAGCVPGECQDDCNNCQSITSGSQVRKTFMRPEECLEVNPPFTTCDHCGHRTTEHYFRCSVCVSGDYDLCPRCFSQGIHCMESNHYLQEFSSGRTESKYYTSVKGAGSRDIILL